MSGRAARRLAWGSLVLYVVLTAVGLVLLARTPNELIPAADDASPFAGDVLFAGVTLILAAVGALIAARLPQHPIGWVLCGIGVLNGVGFLGQGYVRYTRFAEPGALPAPEAAALLANLSIDVQWALVLALVLLFPDGRLPSRRWLPVAALVVAVAVVQVVRTAFTPGAVDGFSGMENPLGLDAARFLREVDLEWAETLLLLPGVVALLVRRRRASAAERQQLKGFLFALTLVALAIVALGLAEVFVGDLSEEAQLLAGVVIVGLFGNLAAALGVAVLKHRLYDIDLVINRALVYGALTATLAGAYIGSVLLLQLVLGPLIEGSALAVAASTLAVAALFRPARARIQRLVDRRFYRRRYDAARTLEAFGGRLRDQVDLDALSGDLRGVVRDTVQPAHVSVWLRGSETGR